MTRLTESDTVVIVSYCGVSTEIEIHVSKIE